VCLLCDIDGLSHNVTVLSHILMWLKHSRARTDCVSLQTTYGYYGLTIVRNKRKWYWWNVQNVVNNDTCLPTGWTGYFEGGFGVHCRGRFFWLVSHERVVLRPFPTASGYRKTSTSHFFCPDRHRQRRASLS